MEGFEATVRQMLFLLFLIAVGWALARFRFVPKNTASILSRLENLLFLPAVGMGSFLGRADRSLLVSSLPLLAGSLALEAVVIALSLLFSRLCTKDSYLRRIYCYGLCFSNFGFMGNAVVRALFPNLFPQYTLFTLVLWVLISVWGVPALLMEGGSGKGAVAALRRLANPLFFGMLAGMVLGLSGLWIPSFLRTAVGALGDCMSPIAMLLTGMTVADADLRVVLRQKSLYAVTVLRLVVYPLLFLGISRVIPFSPDFRICAIAVLAMPLGLNTIVIPNAYGRDTQTAAGMVLVSHLASCVSIPILFRLAGL